MRKRTIVIIVSACVVSLALELAAAIAVMAAAGIVIASIARVASG